MLKLHNRFCSERLENKKIATSCAIKIITQRTIRSELSARLVEISCAE